MDTSSLASTFPFTSATLTQEKGVMYGVNEQNGSLIVFDRFSLENANEVILGKSGSGKSYLLKLELMRQFVFGTEIIIVDPEGEYEKLATTLGGENLSFTQSSPVKINPFDLSGLYEEGENELGLKILSLHALLRLIMGNLSSAQDAMLDRALVETYRQKGITADPSTQKLEPPLMEDLYKIFKKITRHHRWQRAVFLDAAPHAVGLAVDEVHLLPRAETVISPFTPLGLAPTHHGHLFSGAWVTGNRLVLVLEPQALIAYQQGLGDE